VKEKESEKRYLVYPNSINYDSQIPQRGIKLSGNDGNAGLK